MLSPVAGVDAVDHALHGCKRIFTGTELGIEVERIAHTAFQGFLCDGLQGSQGLAGHLHFTSALHQPHQIERLRQRGANHHGPMISQEQHGLARRAGQNSRTFFRVHRDALKVVVRHLAPQLRRIKVGVRQAIFQTTHRHRGGGVNVHHAVRVGHGGMNRAMERETSGVDRPITVSNDVALDVYLHQVRRRHLGVVQTKWVDQEVAFFIRHTQ